MFRNFFRNEHEQVKVCAINCLNKWNVRAEFSKEIMNYISMIWIKILDLKTTTVIFYIQIYN